MKQVSLSQIIGKDGIFIDGDWIESKDQDPDGTVRLIQLADIGDGIFINKSKRYLTLEKASELKCTFLKPGDVLIARMPDPIGRACIFPKLDTQCVTVVDVCVVRPDTNIVLPEWLMYQINDQQFRRQIQKYVTGTTRQRISRGNLEKIKFDVPSLEEQRKTIKMLNQAYSLQKKRRESIKLLEEYISSVFFEMFGDPVENRKQWDVKRLKDISIKILSGTTPKGGTQVYVNKGVLFLRSQNVWRNRLDLDDVAFISEETHSKMRNSSLEYKDLVMTKTGRINTENSSLGRAAIYLGENNRANINGHVYLIRLKKDAVHKFVLFILTTNEYREYIRRICVGGIDKRQINKIHLEEFPIISPPTELQNKFSEIVCKTESVKQKMLLQSKELDMQFQALLQKSFGSS